jgi:hypothetical protein
MTRIHAILLSILMAAGSAGATTIFTTDFELGAPSQFTGASGVTTTTSVNGDAGIDGLQVWQNYTTGNPNAAAILTLSGLAANQTLDLDFTFLAIGSWDGTTQGPSAPDFFDVSLNSSVIFNEAFRNWGVSSPEYPGCTLGGNCNSTSNPAPPANTTVTLQRGNSTDYGTSIYHIIVTGLNANASGDAVFNFFASGTGWQGGGDESFALDNIHVNSADAAPQAPEPSTLVLIGGALLCLPLIRRRAFGR